uniref:Putative secreted peptide n=1 Tax=Anopheles braziliensis TaxID=58242 RepID=A0A2M3ZNJ3_9DIPT
MISLRKMASLHRHLVAFIVWLFDFNLFLALALTLDGGGDGGRCLCCGSINLWVVHLLSIWLLAPALGIRLNETLSLSSAFNWISISDLLLFMFTPILTSLYHLYGTISLSLYRSIVVCSLWWLCTEC